MLSVSSVLKPKERQFLTLLEPGLVENCSEKKVVGICEPWFACSVCASWTVRPVLCSSDWGHCRPRSHALTVWQWRLITNQQLQYNVIFEVEDLQIESFSDSLASSSWTVLAWAEVPARAEYLVMVGPVHESMALLRGPLSFLLLSSDCHWWSTYHHLGKYPSLTEKREREAFLWTKEALVLSLPPPLCPKSVLGEREIKRVSPDQCLRQK